MSENTPPFTVSSKSINLVAEICTRLVSIGTYGESIPPRLRRENRIKSIQSSLAIENNNLTLDEVTDVVDGKRVVGNARDILEVKNAFECYELLNGLNPCELKDLLRIHRLMMKGLQTDAGQLRSVRVGPELVPGLMSDLMSWLESSEDHPLIKSSVFHYEFERIHPFSDGNGRTGRFWHILILSKWHEEFSWIPIETVVRERQNEYYSALAESAGVHPDGGKRHDSAPCNRRTRTQRHRGKGPRNDTHRHIRKHRQCFECPRGLGENRHTCTGLPQREESDSQGGFQEEWRLESPLNG